MHQTASSTSVGMIAISGVSVDEAIDLLPSIPDDRLKMAFIPVYDDKQLIEVVPKSVRVSP